ncbi:MAG: FHA domain-containing protein, partial [Planctomycetes bacterium]|nr:FHA domain-containing protein [Planctomycetota bacterium]
MERIVLDVKLAGSDEPVRVVLESFPAIVGRHDDCEVRIEDKGASRKHAAIEPCGARIRIRDLDSRNGTWVNGARVTERALAPGDEIRVGDAILRVVELEGPPPPVLRATLQRKLASWAIPPVVLILLGAGVVLYIKRDSERAARRADPQAGQGDDASSALAALRKDAAAASRVTDALIERAKALRERYRDPLSPGRDPFGEFLDALESRRRSEVLSALFAAESQVRALLEEERFREALDIARAAPGETLVQDVERAIDGACEQLIADAKYFRDLEREGEGIVRCEALLARVGGTSCEGRLREAIASLRASLAAREKERREAEAAIARAEREAGPAGKAEGPSAPGLWSLLSPRIAAGALREKTYRFPGDLEGSPVAIADGFRVVVEGAAGKAEIAFADVAPALRLDMAGDALDGDDLLEAARFGFAAGQGDAAGLLLLRYASAVGEDRQERQAKVDAFLAAVRGLDRVPEGGFAYSPGHGWEDAGQRADRKAVESAASICRAIPSASTTATLERTFARVERILEDRSLSGSARGEVRRLAIEGLVRLRERTAKNLAAEVGRSGLPALRKVRAELVARRAAALAVIFDTSVYLPESHPDWPKGDEVNGQKAVDEAVAAVRELWDNPGNAVILSSRLRELAAIVHAVDVRL